ncbi:amidohydrolase family protein [Streptomyces sp. NPDC090075]|uniref:amidohydrolase family protein n=1 Tax=Streptomyces sp. NPDC090075 TaxID=3365937 RepID=UPI003823CE9F
MSTQTDTLYPPEGLGAPKDRQGHTGSELNLPQGTEIFSADNHISLADDIFYENFPERLKNKAPRIWYEDGAFEIGVAGKSFLPKEFSRVLMQYDPLTGSNSGNIEGRMEELRSDGIEKELAFPNALLAIFHYPDPEVRELCFRIYNEQIAKLQERSNGRFYGVGLINWWDPKGTRRTLAELKSLGIRTFLMPLNPGKDSEGNQIDYGSMAMDPVWEAIEESGIPVSHHIGETGLKTPCEQNAILVGMVNNVTGFHEVWGRYVFSGILDRHPGLQVGWFEGGASWVASVLQDGEHILASYRHMLDRPVERDVRSYWDNHMYASFMVDPLGMQMLEHIGVDKVMWAADYPHNESTFGYSEKSITMISDAVGPENAAKIVSGNVKRFLGL